MSKPSPAEETDIADITERALEYALIPFGMGVASVRPNLVIGGDVVDRLKARYRPGMRDYLLKHGIKFDDQLRSYLTKRGKQMGANAARLSVEFEVKSIDGDLFEQGAVGVELEIGRLQKKYWAKYDKKLDVICGNTGN